jgi:AcrR family transcriptional regulator
MAKSARVPVQKNSVRKDLVREELLGKAADLFARRGYANTTIQDIARELGLSRSSLYHYFPSKDDVLGALIQETTVATYDMLARLRDDPSLSATERIKRAIMSSVERRLAGGSRMRVLERLEGDMPPEMLEQFNRARRQILQFYVDIIEEGIRSGEFRLVDSKIIAFAVLGMCNWTAWWYSPSGSRTAGEIAETMTEFALAALVRGDGAKPAAGSLGGAIRQLKEDIAVLERLAR